MIRLLIGLFSLLCIFSSYADSSADRQIAELHQKAAQNDALSQYQLGLTYLNGKSNQAGESTLPNQNEALYWFEQAANNHQPQAMLQLAKMYLNGQGTEVKTTEGIYWLTKLSTQGDAQAQFELGKLYQSLKSSPVPSQMAEIWLRSASEAYPEAEQAYAQLLEEKFNQQRAKQVSAIEVLDEEAKAEEQSFTLPSNLDFEKLNWAYVVILASIALLLLVASIYQRQKKQRLNEDALDQLAEQQQIQQKLTESSAVIKKQKRQLETLYHELKKSQKNQMTTAQDQKYQLACAIFGYQPSQVPDEKAIKIRYKQLSKIYHPDMKGSDEEMKRLNGALKIILNTVNN